MLRLAASGAARGILARGVALQTRRCLVTKFSNLAEPDSLPEPY